VTASDEECAPVPCVIQLTAGGDGRGMVLGGPPQTAGMRSGVVVLQPGESVGRHDTGEREEIIVLLEGRGEVRVADVPPLAVAAGTAVYVPPRRNHDVVNTGERPLRYVYVVAPVAP
jgi:oxalate decarboxylase/phosphoglucose isomerase-like protein (cupin superfamily)